MKKYKLKYLFTVLFLISSFTIFSGNLQTVNVVATDLHLHATIRDSYIGWRYDTINGALCKRLYNYTTNCWLGEWIPV